MATRLSTSPSKRYKRCEDKDFVILGFPCNQFGRQEPGSTSDIREFCTRNYGVSFPMMAKVDAKVTNNTRLRLAHQKELSGSGDHNVRWNFHKFLVNEQGELVAALGAGPTRRKFSPSRKDADLGTHCQQKRRPTWVAFFHSCHELQSQDEPYTRSRSRRSLN